jgi:hypothetical protein
MLGWIGRASTYLSDKSLAHQQLQVSLKRTAVLFKTCATSDGLVAASVTLAGAKRKASQESPPSGLKGRLLLR